MKKQKEIKWKIPPTFAVIPSQVRFCRNLSSNAKLLYGDIVLLSHLKGYCEASNEYLGFLYDVDDKTISEWVSQLKKVGFIKVPQLKGYNRHIYPQVGSFREKKDSQENTTIKSENPDTVKSEKPDNNNINTNNINNIAEPANAEPQKEFNLEEEVNKLLGYKSYWMNIIGLFIKRKQVDIRSTKQLQQLIAKYRKVAMELAEFDREQIKKAFIKCETMVDKDKKPFDWSLFTVSKIILK